MASFDDLANELSGNDAEKQATIKKTAKDDHNSEQAIRKVWGNPEAKIDRTERFHDERVMCVEFIGNYATSMAALSASWFKVNKDKSAAKEVFDIL